MEDGSMINFKEIYPNIAEAEFITGYIDRMRETSRALKEMAERANPELLEIEFLRSLNINYKNNNWIWLEILSSENNGWVEPGSESNWRMASYLDPGKIKDFFSCGWPGFMKCYKYSEYGLTWNAFLHKPQPIFLRRKFQCPKDSTPGSY